MDKANQYHEQGIQIMDYGKPVNYKYGQTNSIMDKVKKYIHTRGTKIMDKVSKS